MVEIQVGKSTNIGLENITYFCEEIMTSERLTYMLILEALFEKIISFFVNMFPSIVQETVWSISQPCYDPAFCRMTGTQTGHVNALFNHDDKSE